jgi:hypothetical protein
MPQRSAQIRLSLQQTARGAWYKLTHHWLLSHSVTHIDPAEQVAVFDFTDTEPVRQCLDRTQVGLVIKLEVEMEGLDLCGWGSD